MARWFGVKDRAESAGASPAACPHALRVLVDVMLGSSQAMLVVWGAARTLGYNDAFASFLGADHPGALGRPLAEMWPELEPVVERALAGDPSSTDKTSVLFPAASGEMLLGVSCTTVHDDGGTAAGVFCVLHDLTDRAKTEQALRANDARLRAVFERLPVGVGVCDGQGRTLSLNSAALKVHGFSSVDEMLVHFADYREEFELRHPDGRPMPHEEWPMSRALRGEYVHDYEVRLRRHSGGDERVVSYSAVPAPDGDDGGRRVVFVIHDLTERTRGEEDLRRAYALIEGITQGSQDLIAAADGDFRYIFFNDAYRREFEALWGQDLEVGTSMLEAMAPWPEQGQRAKALWARALAGESFSITTEFGPSEENEQVYDLRFNPVFDGQGRTIGAAHILRNVTEQVRVAQALRESEEMLRESDRRKDELLAMLGHELRNPLAAVRSATELLKLAKTDAALLQRACDVLERQSGHMARLLDGLLEISRFARGKIELQRQLLDLREILEQVLEDCATELTARKLDLCCELPVEPLWVVGDRDRLAQVFANLVGNSLKFTQPTGRIDVAAHLGGNKAVVSICDNGVGIRPEMLSRIFEPFHQENQDIARASGGLGLGLALAKALVDLHEGTIEARSDGPGTGAAFEVCLPITSPSRVPRPPDAPTDGSSVRVLVVEDNADAALMLREILQLRSHEVSIAENGADALAALHARSTDVVLCDIGLPGMSGYDLARAVRGDPALRDVAMVALTGYGQPEDRHRTAEAGFDEHLIKPVSLQALDEVLRRWSPVARRSAGPSADG